MQTAGNDASYKPFAAQRAATVAGREDHGNGLTEFPALPVRAPKTT